MANNNVGAFIPSTQVWDVSEIYAATNDPKLQELFVRMYQNLNRMAIATNVKDSAYYVQQEFVNGQAYFANPATSSATAQSPSLRQVFRFVLNFGALPNTGTTSVAHGLTPTASWTFTRIYGCATNPSTEYIPIPYSSATLINNIELYVDATNVNITTAADYSAYTTTYVIMEYIKT